MERFDLRADIVRALAAAGNAPKGPDRNRQMFRCLRHEDKTPSAWLGEHAWGCFACNFSESLGTLADALGIERPRTGLTLAEYAERKSLDVTKLAAWGVADSTSPYGQPVVAIPYFGVDGKKLRTKFRSKGREGQTKTWWGSDGADVHLYGLDKLVQHAKKPVILVEGESDCHTAWSHNVLAVGAPGAGIWKPGWASELRDRIVYVWEEPDAAGASFVQRVATDLPNARVIRAEGVKDLNDLHRQSGKEFAATVKALMASATPVGQRPPVVPFDAVLGPTLDRIGRKKMEPVDAVPTPIPSWNRQCRDEGGGIGLARGWHITVGAKTGSGKSLIALNLAAEAMRHGERVCFVSLEMSQDQLATRLLAITTGISVTELEQGSTFRSSQWAGAARIMDALHERTGGAVYVNRKRLHRLDDVLASIRYMHDVQGCRYFVVDYLQLAYVQGARSGLDAVTEVSGSVRNLAADLSVVTIGLSQFNRETSKDHENPPMAQGLMGGSPLENDSDQVVLLDHSQIERDAQQQIANTRLLLDKNRHGSVTSVDVQWDYRVLRLRERTPAHLRLEDAPAEADRGEAWEPPHASLETDFPTPEAA